MNKWKQIITSIAIMAGIAALPALPVSAINVFNNCSGNGSTEVCKAAGTDKATDYATIIINTLLFILGIIAVIMIIVGGVKYTTSNGDASRVKSAKDTVMYSVVGLILAVLAFAIVNFVLTRF